MDRDPGSGPPGRGQPSLGPQHQSPAVTTKFHSNYEY